jgi:uncharacterized membrane protein YedE/YeeE
VFLTANHPLGITTALEHTAAFVGQAAAAPVDAELSYFREGNAPRIDWEWMLVLGVFIGAHLSSRLSGGRAAERVPALWRRRFGESSKVRFLGAFLGSALMLFGARLAGGCTSGHGISGTLQLAVSSWVFTPLLFVTGILVAHLLYETEGRRHV